MPLVPAAPVTWPVRKYDPGWVILKIADASPGVLIALMAIRGSTSVNVFMVGVTAPGGGFKSPVLTQMIPPKVAATRMELRKSQQLGAAE